MRMLAGSVVQTRALEYIGLLFSIRGPFISSIIGIVDYSCMFFARRHAFVGQARDLSTTIAECVGDALPLNGRPPTLLGSKRLRKNNPGHGGKEGKDIQTRAKEHTRKARGGDTSKALHPAIKNEDDFKASALRQAVGFVDVSTFAGCASTLKALASTRTTRRPEEASIRYLAERLSQMHSLEMALCPDHRRNLCLAASALARTNVWASSFGDLVQEVLQDETLLKSFNPIDIVQLCRFVASFDRFFSARRVAWKAVLSQLQYQERNGQRLKATGLVSLLRSSVMVNANETPELVEWIRARLLEELPTCSPRQLASVLLDLAAWNGTLIDAKTLDRLQREIRRSIDGHSRGHAMRARDLASIISGYARLPSAVAGLEARQSAMAPLLPEMIRLMPGCSVQDLCELLHGLASTHITDRALLEAWSSNFVHKAHLACTYGFFLVRKPRRQETKTDQTPECCSRGLGTGRI